MFNSIKFYCMKKSILFLLIGALSFSSFAQNYNYDRYTISGGLLGGANFNTFKATGENPKGIGFESTIGLAGGGWVNFPLGKLFSLEPQLMYSTFPYDASNNTGGVSEGALTYMSLPVFLKLHLGNSFAITAGPQFDFLVANQDDKHLYSEDDFTKASVGLGAGVEIFPHGRITVFGRYVSGLGNMLESDDPTTPTFYNQNIQAGLKVRLFGKRIPADSDGDGIADKDDKCPNKAGTAKYNGCPIPDTDGDGVNDEADKCPSQAGLAKYAGCPIPDTDKDGVNDEADKCPNQAGLAKYQGCPVPDTDKDGVNDEADKCPNQAGLAKYNGCPIPDTDGDGVNDESDKCPKTPGIAENLGCPEMTFLYLRDVAELSAEDKANLDIVVKFLNNNPSLSITLEGHTSTLGDAKYNQKLSEKRANGAVAYLVSKGIDKNRLQAKGYGEEFPIGDNSVEAGRAQSRRLVIKIAQ